MLDVYALLKDYKRISIIGMEKNVGKTTLLNFLIKKIGDKKVVGLTSIGRDGEEVDVVTTTSKPRIYVYPNTIIATARDCLRNCDITREILYTTDFSTPMGNIVIVRAITAGYVDIAGPSFNSQIKEILELMEEFGSEISIVDGALSRKGSAMSDVTEATILSTGAALSLDMGKVVDETKTTVSLLNLKNFENKIQREIIEKSFFDARAVVIYKNNKVINLEGVSSLESNEEIKNYFNDEIEVIAIRGAITQKFLETLIKNRQNFKNLTLVIKDGTRVFTDFITLKKIEACGIDIKVLNPINLLFVTCNPHSPLGYDFPKERFKTLLEEKLNIDVIDVVGEKI
ncbi:hypothetical protein [uncultured Fusobacterium sp.]|uniref:lysine 5,6-aminomutase reactivase subunit KamB n=1 Tax=uncultured Fusobacterium sp. TaxID=159267 RepID=UPI0025F7349F|nr:hypothetical protein [uncultured Fusobacterium sp.]